MGASLNWLAALCDLVAILFLVNGKRIVAILPFAVRTSIFKNLFVWMQVCALVLLLA
jgi:hypothetical protein